MHAYIHAYILAFLHTYLQNYILTYICTSVFAYVHSYIRTYIHYCNIALHCTAQHSTASHDMTWHDIHPANLYYIAYIPKLCAERPWYLIHCWNQLWTTSVRIGYLTCNLFLHKDHELMLLLINTMQRDLQSANHIEVGTPKFSHLFLSQPCSVSWPYWYLQFLLYIHEEIKLPFLGFLLRFVLLSLQFVAWSCGLVWL